ncbi:general substrate transporter [Mariannaea sp. PMI_226]|nr:general substrate transporter [Mariannaea sp. PMI_226]
MEDPNQQTGNTHHEGFEIGDIPQGEKHDIDHVELVENHHVAAGSPLHKTTWIIVVLGFYTGLAGFLVNFDLQYTGYVLVMQAFNRDFGHCVTEHGVETCKLTATEQSLSSSIYLLFMAVGALMSGFTANYLGTRSSVQFGCLWVIVGAAGMIGTTGNLVAYIACKCIGAIGLGHLQSSSITFAVECSPPRTRGLLITLFATGSGVGSLVVGAVCYGTEKLTTSWSWKIPILLQVPTGLGFGLAMFFFPESPRWLVNKNKIPRARKAFAALYRVDPDSSEVTSQILDVQLAIEETQKMSAGRHWATIFHRKFIRRTLTALAINVGAGLCGTFFIFTYAAIFFQQLGGFSNSIEISITINGGLFVGLICGPFLVELIGRRMSMIIGYLGMMTCMLIFSAVSSGRSHGNNVRNTEVAFLVLFAYIYGAFTASAHWVASAEMHSVRDRAVGQAFVMVVTNIFIFATNFWTPYMINPQYGNMGTNVGYFYFGVEAVTLIILWFIFPETACLTLEQIDDYFASGRKPWKTSLKRNKKIASGEIGPKDD